MNKIFLFLLCCALHVKGQDAAPSHTSRWNVGLQWAIVHSYNYPLPKFSTGDNFRGAQATADFRIVPRLALQAGVVYLQASTIARAVGIPMAVHYYFLKPKRRFQLYGQLGATVLRIDPFALRVEDSSGNFVPVPAATSVYATYGLGSRWRVVGPVNISFEFLLNKRIAGGTPANNGIFNLGLHYSL